MCVVYITQGSACVFVHASFLTAVSIVTLGALRDLTPELSAQSVLGVGLAHHTGKLLVRE